MFYNSSYDEANYYQGNKFQLGGSDRKGQNLDLVLGKTKAGVWGGRSDDKIMEDAWRALIRNHKIDLRGIDILVSSGAIKLLGKVNSFSEKQEVETTVSKVPGIIDIVNDLKVTRPQI